MTPILNGGGSGAGAGGVFERGGRAQPPVASSAAATSARYERRRMGLSSARTARAAMAGRGVGRCGLAIGRDPGARQSSTGRLAPALYCAPVKVLARGLVVM